MKITKKKIILSQIFFAHVLQITFRQEKIFQLLVYFYSCCCGKVRNDQPRLIGNTCLYIHFCKTEKNIPICTIHCSFQLK